MVTLIIRQHLRLAVIQRVKNDQIHLSKAARTIGSRDQIIYRLLSGKRISGVKANIIKASD